MNRKGERFLSQSFNPGRTELFVSIFHSFNPDPAKLIYLHLQPLEVVSRYRDTQLQVAKNYLDLFSLNTNIWKTLNTHFIPNNSDLVD